MIGEQSASVLWYILALVLVGSALVNRRLPLRSGLGLVMIWIAIFAVAAGIYGQRSQIRRLFSQAPPATEILSSDTKAKTSKHPLSVTIELAPDGHFWTDGEINGHPVRFLIDSGATITALSKATADAAGLNIDMDGPGVMMRTANGSVVARRASVGTLKIGGIQATDIGVIVSDSFGDVNVLGMNFLSKLRSWRVEDGHMVLQGA
jgi:aspartyl protease family protein